MELQTCSFTPAGGWTQELSPALDSERTLLLVFGAPEFRDDDSAIAGLRRTYPRAHMLGCSTAGEIAGALVNDRSLSLAIVRFEHSDVEIATANVSGAADSFAAGARIGASLPPDGLRAVFVLSDGLKVNGSELVKGLSTSLPEGTIVTGGLAADGDRFERTWVLHEGCLQSGVIVAAGLYGDRLRVGHGSRGGWDSFGPERRVTRAAGNVLYELDGKPALALYKEYLGERASGLPATGLLFPLSIRQDTDDAPHLVRTILAVDEATQSMTFAGDIPQGCMARLMRANFDRLVNGASIAADQAAESLAGGPTLAVAISCVGRRLVLGERIEEETEVALEHLPPGTQQVGFYSYGEISPYASGSCDLHNQTMTLTTIAER